MERGSHKSALQHPDFLEGEFVEMMKKGQWILLQYKSVRGLRNLRLSPLGVIPQRNRLPRTIVDYTFSKVNSETLRVAPAEAIQFGRALPRVLQAIFDADPNFGPVQYT